jgi:hypothetical protein
MALPVRPYYLSNPAVALIMFKGEPKPSGWHGFVESPPGKDREWDLRLTFPKLLIPVSGDSSTSHRKEAFLGLHDGKHPISHRLSTLTNINR